MGEWNGVATRQAMQKGDDDKATRRDRWSSARQAARKVVRREQCASAQGKGKRNRGRERARRCEDTQRTDAEQRESWYGLLGSVWGEEGEMRRVRAAAARISPSAPNAQRAGR
jgi:hypothetical protein